MSDARRLELLLNRRPPKHVERTIIPGVVDYWNGTYEQNDPCRFAGVYIIENTETHRFSILFHCCGLTDSIATRAEGPAATSIKSGYDNLQDAVKDADVLRGSWPLVERPTDCIGPPIRLVLGPNKVEDWWNYSSEEMWDLCGHRWEIDTRIRAVTLTEARSKLGGQ